MKGLSAESVRRYISSINIFIQYLNDNELDLLSAYRGLLRKFLEYLRKTRAVSYNTLKTISALCQRYMNSLNMKNISIRAPYLRFEADMFVA